MKQSNDKKTQTLLTQLQHIVGARYLLTGERQTERYRTGFRSGSGSALAVVFPSTLLQQWQLLQACVAADTIVIMQAANTGLTEGSTPSGDNYDRPIVILNTLRLNQIQLLNDGKQVIGFPGSTLNQLEKRLKPYDREPHSVIGSSCIGASVIGGICNNSGGSLIQRGPAYTEMALFAQIDAQGELQLINHLGINLGNTPEEILQCLERGKYRASDIDQGTQQASDHEYATRVRDIDAPTPSRFNADPRRLFEASGCAGKLAVFAVRLDTFPSEKQQQVFYIGTNQTQVLTELRRAILRDFKHLPIAGEYMHRDIFDIAEVYGKDTFVMINSMGTNNMPRFFTLKGKIDARLSKVPFLVDHLTDRIMQGFSQVLPNHLPKRLKSYRNRYEHHLMLKMSGQGITEAQQFLKEFFATAEGNFITCTADEAKKAFLHRFAAAGAAVRYHAVHADKVEDILALDIALPRNEEQWFETLPPEIDQCLVAKLYYGHFLCHVFHQDYIVKKGVDTHALKQKMLALLNDKGAEYPAEHNVGHLYIAKPALKDFYQQIDPTNSFNPGIGKTSKLKYWQTK
ncbi:TPA: D-lactate dehydrogenase [Yersinia enterocolitica]|uniref:Quinone-dependent D-lactate dehydrogenase n=2 Tax=Yersinia enterocolitica TaxID=630 RepID=A0A0H3NMT4_YERE1|nr:D-lactate dehydrogenase [Yersinia enterocolitica]EHB21906.1 D-lactate dehydrogenase [Yersinia enterocolitica subsp. palearctica PhRBD_Ye1]EKN3312762.1 D-lactate dehydrogenase [Yersinia enterocolitica]EKN3316886.1 D-lactate dehydrogenase [Yersinia enterocolitica]EKN3320675.1 D-lactate dehydrogenase [Yersinia enterocolitica]EKN3332965.1 D-lactate dehydrogenase [Yersinia enterocolitica]